MWGGPLCRSQYHICKELLKGFCVAVLQLFTAALYPIDRKTNLNRVEVFIVTLIQLPCVGVGE